MKTRQEIEEMIEFYREDLKKAHKEFEMDIISRRLFLSIRDNHQAKVEALQWVLEERE